MIVTRHPLMDQSSYVVQVTSGVTRMGNTTQTRASGKLSGVPDDGARDGESWTCEVGGNCLIVWDDQSNVRVRGGTVTRGNHNENICGFPEGGLWDFKGEKDG